MSNVPETPAKSLRPSTSGFQIRLAVLDWQAGACLAAYGDAEYVLSWEECLAIGQGLLYHAEAVTSVRKNVSQKWPYSLVPDGKVQVQAPSGHDPLKGPILTLTGLSDQPLPIPAAELLKLAFAYVQTARAVDDMLNGEGEGGDVAITMLHQPFSFRLNEKMFLFKNQPVLVGEALEAAKAATRKELEKYRWERGVSRNQLVGTPTLTMGPPKDSSAE